MTEGSMLTVHECAQRLNMHEGFVRRLIASGRLAGSKCGNTWRVKPEDLEAFLAGARPDPQPAIPVAEQLPEEARTRFM